MNLYKGVFWIVEEQSEQYFFRIPCNSMGDITGATEYPLCAKNGNNYNHKILWSLLSKSLTQNKPFDYFPRGRVEIHNAKAIVYLNPDINTEEIQNHIIDGFGLTKETGIESVRVISDGSNHYKYLNDKGENI